MWGEPSLVFDGYRRRSREDLELVTSLLLVPSLTVRLFVPPPSHVCVACTWTALPFYTLMLYPYLYVYLRTAVFCNRKSDKMDFRKTTKRFIRLIWSWPIGLLVGRDSDWLRNGRSVCRIPLGARFSATVQTGAEVHPTSYSVCTCFSPLV